MKTLSKLLLICLFIGFANQVNAQAQSSSFWKPSPPNYKVKHALEFESLVPMFFSGGYHFGIGYRYKKFRFRFSIINGGTYNVDGQAVDDTPEGYERYYTPSPGYFLGYNVWKNLEVYGYYERHTFEIKQLATHERQDILSNDFGVGVSYQFFIGRIFYIQPGIHSYFRSAKDAVFLNLDTYSIPTFELSPVVRIGARVFKKFE